MVQALSAQNYSFGLGFDYGDINIAVGATTAGTGSPWEHRPGTRRRGRPTASSIRIGGSAGAAAKRSACA
jgi:hypothetical protein